MFRKYQHLAGALPTPLRGAQNLHLQSLPIPLLGSSVIFLHPSTVLLMGRNRAGSTELFSWKLLSSVFIQICINSDLKLLLPVLIQIMSGIVIIDL